MLPSIFNFGAAQAAQAILGPVSISIPQGIQPPVTAGFINPVVSPSRGGYAICVSGTVSVSASAQNVKLNYESPANQTALTQNILDFVSEGSKFMETVTGPRETISGTFNIGASLCMPANGTASSTVQFLTHGTTFDRYYWDFGQGYSYVDFAARWGYSTFLYDRLGGGVSERPDPITVVQEPIHNAIAIELIHMLRNGLLGGKFFSQVVGVGHSYGSFVTQAVTVRDPKAFDAVMFTGFSSSVTGFGPFLMGSNYQIAALNDPYRFGGLSNSYITYDSISSCQAGFFTSPGFDPLVLVQTYAQRSTVTLGEFWTSGADFLPAVNFTGPVAVVNGLSDMSFCGGNCMYPNDKTAALLSDMYPNAQTIGENMLVLPDTGHCINLHYSAEKAYKFIHDFLKRQGL